MIHNNYYPSLTLIKSQRHEIKPFISLAIRVKNESKGIEAFWTSLINQTYFNYCEIVFLDSGSSDNTLKFIQKLNCTIYTVKAEEFNFGSSCNLMMQLTTCAYTCFFSGHTVLQDNSMLEKAVRFIKDNDISGYFRQIPNPQYGFSDYDQSFLKYRFPTSQKKNPIRVKRNHSFSNAASIICRKHWEAVQFEQKWFGEDKVWADEINKMGFSLYYFHQSNVMHSHNDSYNDVYNRVIQSAMANFPEGIGPIKRVPIFLKVFTAIFLTSGKFFTSLKFARAHTRAYNKNNYKTV